MIVASLASAEAPPDEVLEALDAELDRTLAAWEGEPDAPYFLGHRVSERQRVQIPAHYE